MTLSSQTRKENIKKMTSYKLPMNRMIYTDTGLEDHRIIFVIPRKEKTYFGTTNTPYEGDLKEKTNHLSLQYALEYEMVMTPVDYFLRRTETLLFATEKMSELTEPVLEYMARYFGWDKTEKAQGSSRLEDAVRKTQLKNVK